MINVLINDTNRLSHPSGVKENGIHPTREPTFIALWSSSDAQVPFAESAWAP